MELHKLTNLISDSLLDEILQRPGGLLSDSWSRPGGKVHREVLFQQTRGK